MLVIGLGWAEPKWRSVLVVCRVQCDWHAFLSGKTVTDEVLIPNWATLTKMSNCTPMDIFMEPTDGIRRFAAKTDSYRTLRSSVTNPEP
jgi:hypothetical protein